MPEELIPLAIDLVAPDVDLMVRREASGLMLALAKGRPLGVQVRYEGVIERRGVDLPVTLQLVLHVAGDVGVSVIASWLYDWLKGRAARLQVRRNDTAIEERAIERALANNETFMKCHQCGTPAMFLAGPEENIPLCLDCNLKLQSLQARQLAEMERAVNHTVEQMETIAGLPLGGKFPPRPQPAIIAGGAVLNNIHVSGSQVGVLNTGSIGSIDAAVTVIRDQGGRELAAALANFTETVAGSHELPAELRRQVVDLVSTIATEAVAPQQRRKPAVVRALMVDVAQLVSGVASVAQLWASYGPAIKTFFHLPS